jgi:Iron-containing redox enzyme
MLRLPPAAGPISSSLFDYLRTATAIEPLEPPPDPIADRDVQLALYVANELHYGGVEEVADELEWDPEVAALRAALGDAMLGQLLAECGPEERIEPARVPERIFELIAADDSPPLARYLHARADVEQFREFVMHRSAYQLKEADPHTFTIPRVHGPAKAAMVEIQADEYGGGDAPRMHSALFARTMAALGLDPTPGAYVARLPGETLATVNLITLFAMRRRWRGALVGHLTGFEITSPEPNRRYANGLRRLGFGTEATEFYDEHVEADSVHENIAAYDLAGGLARQEPALAGQILFGVSALLYTERRFAGQILDSFEAGRSSLVDEQALAASA